MDKIKLEIVGLTSSHTQTGSFALVMGEVDGNRRLPIIIGMFEAQAIAIEIEKIDSNRPMTHDLFKSFSQVFDFNLKEVYISDLREGVFFAKIICSRNGYDDNFEIDARPSDAIALALRFGVTINTNETILSEAGIIFSDSETDKAVSASQGKEQVKDKDVKQKSLNELTLEELNSNMQAALTKEDYEKAAKIRDEINRRES